MRTALAGQGSESPSVRCRSRWRTGSFSSAGACGAVLSAAGALLSAAGALLSAAGALLSAAGALLLAAASAEAAVDPELDSSPPALAPAE
jgi:hypothetical protein